MEVNPKATSYAKASLEINAPAARIYEILTNVSAWPSWNPDVKKVTFEGALEVGSTFKWQSGMSITSTVKELKPHSVVGWTGETIGTRAVHIWRIEDAGNEKSKVSTEESFDGWLPWCMPGTMSKMLDDTLNRHLKYLQQAAETK